MAASPGSGGDGGPDLARDLPGRSGERLAAPRRASAQAAEIAVLMEVAAWREREAQSRDVPRGRILKDDALVGHRRSAPSDVEALGRLRSIPNGLRAARARAPRSSKPSPAALARDPKTVPMPERSRRSAAASAMVEFLKVLLKAVAEKEGVAPKIIATVEELEAIAEDDGADVPSLHGWRRRLVRRKALALKNGRFGLAMQWRPGRRAGGRSGEAERRVRRGDWRPRSPLTDMRQRGGG